MYTFIVLGIVPGTNIRITFGDWLQLAVLIFAAIVTIKLYRKLEPLMFSQLNQLQTERSPLHASQLHQRAQ